MIRTLVKRESISQLGACSRVLVSLSQVSLRCHKLDTGIISITSKINLPSPSAQTAHAEEPIEKSPAITFEYLLRDTGLLDLVNVH